MEPARTPQIIAHRGASAHRAEHTLAAYQLAIEQGADALECDVRLTVDGHLVCVHDRRIDRTSDGWGVVSTKTLAQLQRHDFGSWSTLPNPPTRRPLRERTRAVNRERGWSGKQRRSWTWDRERLWDWEDPPIIDTVTDRILTLPTLLDLILSAPRPIQLAIETKHPTRYAGWVEQAVVAQLRRFGLGSPPRDGTSRVRVMSFSEQAMRRMRRLAPAIPTVFLMDRVPLRMRSGLLPFGARIAGPDLAILKEHPGYVRRLHAFGHQVHVWTVDTPEDVRYCRDLGVEAIITNRPGDVRAVLAL